MPRQRQRRTSLPKAAAVLDDILACEAELRKLKRLYKLVKDLEEGVVRPPRPAGPPAPVEKPFYEGAPVGLPVANDDDND